MKSFQDKITGACGFIYYEPTIFLSYLKHFLTNTYPESPNLLKLSTEELCSELSNGKSLIRVGDGESMLLTGRSIHFQTFSAHLRNKLKEIIVSYSESSSYILSVPHFALEEDTESLKSRGRLRIWRLFRILFKKIFPKHVKYADAVVFYHKSTFDIIVDCLSSSSLIFVSNERNLTKDLKKYLFNKSIIHTCIISPDSDAYAHYDELTSEINKALIKNPNSIIITAAGPAGKIICYDFTNKGTQCIDLGHGIEIIGKDNDYTSRL